MKRRGDQLSGRLLPAALIALLGVGALIVLSAIIIVVARQSSEPIELPTVPTSIPADERSTEPADNVPPAPSNTVTEFYPESANLSDCVGLVEKPGCGSGSRGGWRQTLVFVILFAGLGVVLWRISRGIKANRIAIDADAERTTDHS